MKWICSIDIEHWADTRECQGTLPYLIRRLIRATCPSIQAIKFPSGEDVQRSGWDGILENGEATEYLPEGLSLWEMGAGQNPKQKADEDYQKRSEDALGRNPNDSTFIFVTPRRWQDAEKWVAEKKQEGIWKDIKVYDAQTLEEWIEEAPAVGRWLAQHLRIIPSEGIQSAEDFWTEWRSGTDFNLNPDILLGGRENKKDELIKQTNGPGLIPVQSFAIDESIAFMVACFMNSDHTVSENFFSRSLIVDHVQTFRALSNHQRRLILIPKFGDDTPFNEAAQRHTILVPLHPDSKNNLGDNIIKLPPIARDGFISSLKVSLEEAGKSPALAEDYAHKSGKNITIFRRLYEFNRVTPKWAQDDHVFDVIPAVLVAKWDENSEEDKSVVSKIADCAYDEYIKKIVRWKHSSDLIVQIRSKWSKCSKCSKWRLISPLDAWTNAAKYITESDFKKLEEVFQRICEQKLEISNDLETGLLQTLTLTSLYGEKLGIHVSSITPRVDRIVHEILNIDLEGHFSSGPAILITNSKKNFYGEFSLLAEASPDAFLDVIEQHFKSATSFELDNRDFLAALEMLAWFPKYFSRVSLLLAHLSDIDSVEHMYTNSVPLNSLAAIFKSWYPQTKASLQDRQNVLELIVKNHPKVAWKLLMGMLPQGPDSAFPTQKPRWRLSELEAKATWQDIWDTHSKAVELLLKLFAPDPSEAQFVDLLEVSTFFLPNNDRENILSCLENVWKRVEHKDHLAWHKCRSILRHHRSYPDAKWALPEDKLSAYQKLYDLLTSQDEIEQIIHLFDENYPREESTKLRPTTWFFKKNYLCKERVEALSKIYKKHGLQKVIELSQKVKDPPGIFGVGETLADIIKSDEEIIRLPFDHIPENNFFIQGFISGKSDLDPNWTIHWFEQLRKKGYSHSSLVHFLLASVKTKELWKFIDLQNHDIIQDYWQKVNLSMLAKFDIHTNIFAIEKSLHYNNLSCISFLNMNIEEIPSHLIIKALENEGKHKSSDMYTIHILFKKLDDRKDVNSEKICELEWMFIEEFWRDMHERRTLCLHKKLSQDPTFFAEKLRDKESLYLLGHWQEMPGGDNDGNIDVNALKNWVYKVRELTKANDMLRQADDYIGQMLAKHPRKDKICPRDEICELIEELNSKEINNGFSVCISGSNIRSYSTGFFEGGAQQWQEAQDLNDCAEACRNRFPTVAKIFEQAAAFREQEAKRWDDEAKENNLKY